MVITSKSQMYEYIRRWEESGQRQIDFCFQEGLSLSRFTHWRGVYLKEKPEQSCTASTGGAFYPLEVTTPVAAGAGSVPVFRVTISYPNGVKVKLQGVDIHQAAQRNAMMYSFFACCKRAQVEPFEWIRDVIQRIPDQKPSRMDELLPNKWTPTLPENTK